MAERPLKGRRRRDRLDGRVAITRKRKPGQQTEYALLGKEGRQTDYRDCYCAEILEYFGSAQPWEINYTDKGGAQVIPKDRMPTVGRFAQAIGVGVACVYRWTRKHPEFAQAYAEALEMQKSFIMESGGIAMNAGFATFMLKSAHKMRDDEPVEEDDETGDVAVEPAGKGQGE
jgi:hypothetical protein